MTPNIDFTIYSGDSRSITVIVTDQNNNPVNISNHTISFAVSNSSTGTVLFTKTTASGITITNAVGGIFAINLTSSDTNTLNGTYDYMIRVTDTLNNSSIVLTGNMIVKKSTI